MASALKLHGSPISTATMRVLAGLHEKGLEFEFSPVDMSIGAHKLQPYLSLNPFGLVPALEDGSLKLFESRAITTHLAHSYADKGNQLILPGKERAALLVWQEVEAHQFEPIAVKLLWELFYKPMFGLEADPSVVKENEDKLAKVLDVYEARLGQSKYLAGEQYTLADMHHLPAVSLLSGTQVKKLFDTRPCVAAWAAVILARPAWAKVQALRNAPQQ
ncbi:hypothetical protein MLD38_031782 [Melastoma candidum]|uniref:Uncharacterized protein n=1 Tax=Melastoma candidum TaxID=119954 RepID=A0ACB9MSQ3_9MYRT|nr:hypothetical protein MLD38_031782 [Melastoma candidum]